MICAAAASMPMLWRNQCPAPCWVRDKIVTIRPVHFRVFRVFRGSFFLGAVLASPAMKANLIQNYLKATRFKLGLLVNFGRYLKLQMERIVAERGRYGYGN